MDLIILGIVAVWLIFRLFSIIGQDLEGNTDSFKGVTDIVNDIKKAADKPDQQEDKVIDIKVNEKSKKNSNVINKITTIYPDFEVESFINGVQICFSNTVHSFAEGNEIALKELLTPKAYKVFSNAVDKRNKNGERAVDIVQGFVEIELLNAVKHGKSIDVSVSLTTDQINVIYDNEDRVIEGHPSDVIRLSDKWVFTREINSTTLEWYVKETS